MSMLTNVYDRIDAVAAAGRLPVVVFDLDSTLFDTAARHHRILREFAHDHGDPALLAGVAGLALTDFGWDLVDPLRARGFDSPELHGSLREYWAARFFTDDYVLEDHASEGAPEFVTGCYERGAFIYYLTGRHVGGMETGTQSALLRRGFPALRGRVALHLKPAAHLNDRAFKDTAIAEIRSLRGDVVATFENEPGNANMFQAAFPDAHTFLVGSVHAPEPEAPHPAVLRIRNFLLG